MQGFNMGRYRQPSTLDSALSTSSEQPRSKRARLSTWSTPSQPTIRFEMPFAIWCSTCSPPSTSGPDPSSTTEPALKSATALIGQGVRFNAFKTRVGSYHTTPIWSFRMKHIPCGGWIEIRTDPAKSDFVVTDGARKRNQGDDRDVAERVGGVLVGGKEEEEDRARRRDDAFMMLEGKKVDKERIDGEKARVEELRVLKERDWKDTDAKNAKLRRGFRVGRKAREKDAEGVEKLKDKMGLGLEIVEEDEDDRRRAGFVEFGEVGVGVDAATKPLFKSRTHKIESNPASEGQLGSLRKQLAGNTRAALNPFSNKGVERKVGLISRVKRRKERLARHDAAQDESRRGTVDYSSGIDVQTDAKSSVAGLVDYDSD